MNIELDEATANDLHLLAGAWGGISPGAAVARLIAEFRATAALAPGVTATAASTVEIHADYAGTRVRGTYDPETTAIRVIDGPLAGKLYPKPSTASRAVIGLLNPSQKSKSANGFEFWTVTSTGKRLQSVRKNPPARRNRR
jgi:hypothetical protein